MAPPSSSSSSEGDTARFAAVAVSADALQHHNEKLKKIAQRRQARAAKRRAGGGGILGAVPGDRGDSGSEQGGDSGFLDAAQLRVAEALQARLQQELEVVDAGLPHEQPEQAANGGGEHVRLFRRVAVGAPVIEHNPAGNQQGQSQDKATQAGTSKRRRLEAPSAARCQAAAVEAADILRAAKAAAQRAAGSITSPAGWLPADDDPSRLSHRRKRRADKLEAEAAAWRQQHAMR